MQLTLKSKPFKSIKFFCLLSFLTAAANASIATWVYNILISLSGDVQLNPGPKNRCDINFSICYWNLNSIAAHKFINSVQFVYPRHTLTLSSIISDDGNLEILGYNLIQSNHPSNINLDGVCIYYKFPVPLRVLNIHYLKQSISFEVKVGDTLCNFISLYRYPSQTQKEFEKFSENLERNLVVPKQLFHSYSYRRFQS